jgi:hypothetical protein
MDITVRSRVLQGSLALCAKRHDIFESQVRLTLLVCRTNMPSWAKTRLLPPRRDTHHILGTMARRRRRARKQCLVSTSQGRDRTDTPTQVYNTSFPVLHALLPVSSTNENVDPNPNLVVPRRSKREHEALQLRPYNQGTWSDKERLLFLSGMRVYGLGRWKEIGTILTSRYETMWDEST